MLIIDGSPRPFLNGLEVVDIISLFEPSQLLLLKAYSDNISKSVYGMAGFAGVIMIETKKGFKEVVKDEKNSNPEGFHFFFILGFTNFPKFPEYLLLIDISQKSRKFIGIRT